MYLNIPGIVTVARRSHAIFVSVSVFLGCGIHQSTAVFSKPTNKKSFALVTLNTMQVLEKFSCKTTFVRTRTLLFLSSFSKQAGQQGQFFFGSPGSLP